MTLLPTNLIPVRVSAESSRFGTLTPTSTKVIASSGAHTYGVVMAFTNACPSSKSVDPCRLLVGGGGESPTAEPTDAGCALGAGCGSARRIP
jgi:hypothetical protein